MKRIGVLLVAGLLSACASSSSEETAAEATCPQVAIVRDLARYVDDGRADNPAPKDVVMQAALRSFEGSCDYQNDSVEVDFTLNIAAQRGPSLGGDRVSVPYFVAVLDGADEIQSKQVLSADFRLSDAEIVEKEEPFVISIPRSAGKDLSRYRIWVGFQLTERQLARLRNEPLPESPAAAIMPKQAPSEQPEAQADDNSSERKE
jgi:hypothetical protein